MGVADGDVLDALVAVVREPTSSWETDKADAWHEETESMSAELNTAWQSVRFARESRKANPRYRLTRARGRSRDGSAPDREASYEEILQRVDEGISHLRHLARTLHDAAYAEGAWDERFRERWAAVVRDAGHAIADPDVDVEPIEDRITALAREMATDRSLPEESWPLYGSLPVQHAPYRRHRRRCRLGPRSTRSDDREPADLRTSRRQGDRSGRCQRVRPLLDGSARTREPTPPRRCAVLLLG